MKYATVYDVEAGFRALTDEETHKCNQLLEEAAVIIDANNADAAEDRKKVVTCHMVRRAIGDGLGTGMPIGATTGSMSALGYSQSWTIASGATGELYLSKIDKKLLGISNRIGSRSPLEG